MNTNPQLPSRSRAQQLPNAKTSGRQLRRRDRILEIQNERIGLTGDGLDLLTLAIPRDEQQRSQQRVHAGRFIMSAARLQEATSSSRWL